jgi:hypothetical protein
MCSYHINEQTRLKHARWALSLQEFTFIFTHRSGITHHNADVPSRYPQPRKKENTGARLDEEHISAVTTYGVWTSSLSQWRCSNEWTVAMPAFNQSEGNQDVEEDPSGLSDEDPERHAKCTRVIHHAIMKVKRNLSSTPTLLTKTKVTKQAVKDKVNCESLRMNPISSSFFVNAQKCLVLYEPFGGMCVGLEMILRCNIPIHQYYYSDIDHIARKLAVTRLITFYERFPLLLPNAAFQHAFVLHKTSMMLTVKGC